MSTQKPTLKVVIRQEKAPYNLSIVFWEGAAYKSDLVFFNHGEHATGEYDYYRDRTTAVKVVDNEYRDLLKLFKQIYSGYNVVVMKKLVPNTITTH